MLTHFMRSTWKMRTASKIVYVPEFERQSIEEAVTVIDDGGFCSDRDGA